jgi:hypothetical protein
MPAKSSKQPRRGLSLERCENRIILSDPDPKTMYATYAKVFDSIAKGMKAKTVKVHFDEPNMKRSLLLVFSEDELSKKYGTRLEAGSGDITASNVKKILEEIHGFDVAVEIGEIMITFFHDNRMQLISEQKIAEALWAHLQKILPKAYVIE